MDVKFMTVKEAAELLGLRHMTVAYHVRHGHIPAVKIGNVRVVNIDDVRERMLIYGSSKVREKIAQEELIAVA